jgi:hypothetical protein
VFPIWSSDLARFFWVSISFRAHCMFDVLCLLILPFHLGIL